MHGLKLRIYLWRNIANFPLTIPTLEEVYHMKPITYGCEDHRLKMLKDEEQEKRSTDAMGLCKARKLLLRETVDEAGKDEYAYDDLVSDITELFWSGQKMARNPKSGISW